MGKKGICLVDFEDSEGIFNLDLAARSVGVPVAIWDGKTIKMVGGEPSPGNREALAYALSLPKAKAAEFAEQRSEEHTSELQSLMRISYAVFCLKKKLKPVTCPSDQPLHTTRNNNHS